MARFRLWNINWFHLRGVEISFFLLWIWYTSSIFLFSKLLLLAVWSLWNVNFLLGIQIEWWRMKMGDTRKIGHIHSWRRISFPFSCDSSSSIGIAYLVYVSGIGWRLIQSTAVISYFRPHLLVFSSHAVAMKHWCKNEYWKLLHIYVICYGILSLVKWLWGANTM